jgi:hypothetical protein
MRLKKSFKTPFVVTIAGSVVQTAACGGATSEAPSHNTHAETAAGGTGQGTGGTGGGSGGGVNPPAVLECPPEFDSYGSACPLAGTCTRAFTCASGDRTFTLHCDPMPPPAPAGAHTWSLDAPCELPFDHCHSDVGPSPGADCIGGQWRLLGVGGNPPAPCPMEAPTVGVACRPGGFGGDREQCGYRCADGTGWTILGCLPGHADAGITPNTWQSDAACSPKP